MPVTLTPLPQPGDLITAEWMSRLANASIDLYAQVESLSRRLAVLEQGGGKRGPDLVAIDPNRFDVFINKIRGTDVKILDERDKSKRLEKVKQLWLEERKDVLLDDEVRESQEITEQEWVLLGAAAGIKPSEVPQALAVNYPASSRAVTAEFGNAIFELDGFTNLSAGKIGFR